MAGESSQKVGTTNQTVARYSDQHYLNNQPLRSPFSDQNYRYNQQVYTNKVWEETAYEYLTYIFSNLYLSVRNFE